MQTSYLNSKYTQISILQVLNTKCVQSLTQEWGAIQELGHKNKPS